MRLAEAPHPDLEWIETLPPFEISKVDFEGLYDYSASFPSGKKVGKTWKCNLLFGAKGSVTQMIYEGRVIRYRHPPAWVIRQYVVCDGNHPEHDQYMKQGGCLAIHMFRPVLR